MSLGAVEHGQRLAGHGSVVDEAVRQLEAGRRHPLERLVQGGRRVTHIVLLLLRPMNPRRSGSGVDVPLRVAVPRAACTPGYGAVHASVPGAVAAQPAPCGPRTLS